MTQAVTGVQAAVWYDLVAASVAVDHHGHRRSDNRRQADAAWELLASGRIACDEIVQPVVRFEDAVAAYKENVDEHPERSVKLGIVFG